VTARDARSLVLSDRRATRPGALITDRRKRPVTSYAAFPSVTGARDVSRQPMGGVWLPHSRDILMEIDVEPTDPWGS
jgi:hypothetical protein